MKKISVLYILVFLALGAKSQTVAHDLVGYWHNWNDVNAPYVQLDQIDARYTVINLSFAVPKTGTDYDMEFVPVQVSPAVLIQQIQSLQSQGKKVNISIGGATAPVSLDNASEKNTFISSMGNILNTYGFDGMDIDLEGSSLSVSGGTISAPTDAAIINLIDATKSIMANYHIQNSKKLMLTMAPETAFVQGGQSAYSGIWGAYLPVIQALKDSIDLLHVQLYNSGTMYGLDNNVYTQGTADFIIAMTEAVIQGFSTASGQFNGLPATKVSIGLPACTNAAGGGYTPPTTVFAAVKYLLGAGPKPGSYTLVNTNGYPDLNGMMTWSINWDAVSSCGVANEYAILYESLFGSTIPTSTSDINKPIERSVLYPNPCNNFLHVQVKEGERVHLQLFNLHGQLMYENDVANHQSVDISHFSPGLYIANMNGEYRRFLKSNE